MAWSLCPDDPEEKKRLIIAAERKLRGYPELSPPNYRDVSLDAYLARLGDEYNAKREARLREIERMTTAQRIALTSSGEKGFKYEQELANAVTAELAADFHTYPEVWGTHFSGMRLRLDLVVTPKEPDRWKRQNVALGVEFKSELCTRGSGAFAAQAQAVDYANTNWDGFGYMYIFLFPGVGRSISHGDNTYHQLRLLDGLGVGQLVWNAGALQFELANDIVWSSRINPYSGKRYGDNGVEKGRHWNMTRKFGAR